ncbi:defense protein 3 [Papilio machaon]|uniref:defense protein 3 n=1 Tax=Papilio machaon TaxID=76193 RepID=UPI001E664354|nr:defense protein 3 [Papilio machaon]
MPLEVNGVENPDKSKDLGISFTKGNVFGGTSLEGIRDAGDFPKPIGPSYDAASASLGVFSEAGHSAGITAAHRPDFGNQVTAAANLNVLNKGNHKVDVNTFTTKNFPIGPTPNYSVHGAGVNYQYKDIAQVGASVARTPIAQRTDYSISSGLKLHQTPTSSFSANIGASKFDAPYSKGNWTPNAFFHYQKRF